MRRIVALCLSLAAIAAHAADLQRIVVSAPGPRNISYLPVDLIPAIKADEEEGVDIQILHTGGGAVALNNMVSKNADFAVAGVPAAMSLKSNGGDVVVIAPVNDVPLFVLMVRTGLKGKVRTISDLRGKVVGVNTSTKFSKTTSQQLAELLLKSGGVSIEDVRIVPAGQSWVEQSSLMISGAADAVMGDEPFASRLQKDGKVFFLAHLAQPETIKGILGTNFLHAALETRSEIIAKEPAKAEKMVRMLKKSLAWMASHTPEQVADALGVKDPVERESLVSALKKYPKSFSKDGKFSTRQLKETDVFFHTSLEPGMPGKELSVEQMLDDRWAGRRE
jgi:NitT/TauT family transport system substrate-binding protein